MKERPILFSGPMVRAILDGQKTQTRRIVKLPVKDPVTGGEVAGCELNGFLRNGEHGCPYGQPGDRLWVRETWTKNLSGVIWYRADGHPIAGGFWKPSIHMPRWASRITLEIVSVRVERLRDISNEDCWKEGMSDATNPEVKANRKWFSELRESINGPFSWDVNPWVWVVEFKEVKS